MSNGRRNSGVALITAMLISAIVTMVAANLAWDNALDVRRTTVLLYRDQAVQVALGVLAPTQLPAPPEEVHA